MFQQMWLGAWRKYSPVPYAATNERKVNEKLDRACKALLLEVDRTNQGASSPISTTLPRVA
jgi:hypothetical protein